MTTPSDLLSAELRRDGSRPLLTYYDDATGERVELSVATTANWVAKTAGFLTDEHGIDAGGLVTVRLPLHWQTAVVLLACWAAGAQVSFDDGGLVTFTTPELAVDGEAVVLSLAPMGVDFSRLVAAQPDHFVPLDAQRRRPGRRGRDRPPQRRPGADRAALRRRRCPVVRLDHPLAVSGSVVLVANADPVQVAAHAETERVTHTLGMSIERPPPPRPRPRG